MTERTADPVVTNVCGRAGDRRTSPVKRSTSRSSFDSGAGASSVFTQLLESGLPDEETHIVHRGPSCFAIMNAFPYTNGHLMVLPYREVPDLLDLDAAEIGELWAP